MIKIFTQTDLIRYLYHETTEEERTEIDKALIRDGELKALYNDLCALMQSLKDIELEPSGKTVLNILSYSRSRQEKER